MWSVLVRLTPRKKKLSKKPKKLLNKFGKVLDENSVGELDLAYEIEKEQKGFYFWLDFEIEPEELKKAAKALEGSDLLRYLISKKPKEALKQETSQKKQVSAPAKKESPDRKARQGEKPRRPKGSESRPQSASGKKVSRKKTKRVKPEKDEDKRMEDLDKKLEDIL